MGDSRGTMRTIRASGLDRTWNRTEQSIEESISKPRNAQSFFIALLSGETGSGHHGDDAGNILCSRSTFTLLTTAELAGSDGHSLSHDQDAHSLRATELVRAQTE